MTFNTKFCT